MAGLMYFVEGATAPVTREQLAAWGLAHAFDAVPNHCSSAGPGGKTGVLLCDLSRMGDWQPVYRPDEQTWVQAKRKFTPGPAWHVGHYQAAPPTPRDLARSAPLMGSDVTLAGGRTWHVPLVRTTLGDGSQRSPLPSYVTLDDDGQPVPGEVVDEHAWLLEAVTPFWDLWVEAFEASDPGAASFVFDVPASIFADAARVLGANYRIGPTECDLLKVFRNDGNMPAVMMAACDCDYAHAVLQKKRALASGA